MLRALTVVRKRESTFGFCVLPWLYLEIKKPMLRCELTWSQPAWASSSK